MGGVAVALLIVSASVALGAGCASRAAGGPVAAAEAQPSDPVRAPQEPRAASEGADEALARADEVNARLSRLWATRNRRTLVETLHVQFRSGREELDDAAHAALRHVLEELRKNENLLVNVEGYTDTDGPHDKNVELSRRRAETVRLYLVERGVDLWRIQAIGRGPLADTSVPPDKKRRVTIKLIAPSE
jgi:outer membrane protein OmpA-like peptidoglycan-associated protein